MHAWAHVATIYTTVPPICVSNFAIIIHQRERERESGEILTKNQNTNFSFRERERERGRAGGGERRYFCCIGSRGWWVMYTCLTLIFGQDFPTLPKS